MTLLWYDDLVALGGDDGPLVGKAPAWLWHGAGVGESLAEAYHAFARREVAAVGRAADFGSAASVDVIALLRNAARGLTTAPGGWSRGSTLELLYITEPRPGEPTRVRLYLTAKGLASGVQEAAGAAESIADHACAALPAGFRTARVPATTRVWQSPDSFDAVEVRKQEELLQPQLRDVPADYFYVAYPISGDGSGWPQFGEVLARATESVAVSLLFAPTALAPAESTAISSVTTQLEWFGRPRQEQDIMGQTQPVAADASAAAVLPIWQGYQQRLRQCVLARATVLGPSPAAMSVAKALSTAVSASREPAGGAAPVCQRPKDDDSWGRMQHSVATLDLVPWGGSSVWRRPDAPLPLRRLPYLYGVDEAAVLAVLPVPDEHGARGFPLARAGRAGHVRPQAPAEPAVALGVFEDRGQVTSATAAIPLTALNRHTLVVGAPGSGKTTTVLSLLVRLWRDQGIPFLAIEPTKTEYRSMLSIPGMGRMRVITLGRDDVAPLRMNPLAPPPGVRRETHLNAVMSVFKAALPLMPPLPSLLEEAVSRAYDKAGWDYDTTPEDGRRAPTLRDVLETYRAEFHSFEYSGQVADNLKAALSLRLRSLTSGTRGLLLDTVESVDFAELMGRPVVIELDEVSDRDDKAVLAAFVLERVRAAARARGSTAGRLAHVTVLEEAHRLLSRVGGAMEDSPQASAIRSFCDAIAELRALGEGFVISSQSPSALAEAAVSNTGTRIIHRLESAADRDIVLADFDAADVERTAAARLSRGEAVVRWPGLDELEFVQVQADAGVDSGRPVSDDEVRNAMAAENDAVWQMVPYGLCTPELCPHGCALAVRSRGRSIARERGEDAAVLWKRHAGKPAAVAPISQMLLRASNGEARTAYCAAVHLAVDGKAFNVSSKRDIRPRLVRGITEASTPTREEGS